jgi:hypothetical protein
VSAPNIGIDWPSWISAICAIVAIIVSVITAFKSRKYYTEYALVSNDGNVLSHKGFSDYGLHVRLDFVAIDDSRPETTVPEYTVNFNKSRVAPATCCRCCEATRGFSPV